ncbi:unnamed protein product [Penicillium nalgiovense]|nr:unnamed protein product [Penicillium nalgiovense]
MVDAILSLPVIGEDNFYVFSGTQYCKVSFADDEIKSGPHWITSWWGTMKDAGFGRVDAVVPVPGCPNEFYAFFGGHYFRASIDSAGDDKFNHGVFSIAKNWSLTDAGFDTVDAAVIDPSDNDNIYFFSGTKTLQYRFSTDKVVWGPHPITEGWAALGEAGFDRIDAIFQKPGETNVYYVFRGNKYVRINWNGTAKESTISRGVDLIQNQWMALKSWV